MLDKQIEFYEGSVSQLLSPRLSALITTVDLKGRVNAAPFSFVMPVSYDPVRVAFSCINHKHFFIPGVHYTDTKPMEEMPKSEQYAGETDETSKDTIANVMEQGEFGINILPIEYLHQMTITASRYPYGVNELEVAGLTPYPSTRIKPPLIKEAKAALECVKIHHYTFGLSPQVWTLVIGEGLAAHVDSEVFEGKELKPQRMRSILEFNGPNFGVCTDFRHEPYVLYPDVIPMPKRVE